MALTYFVVMVERSRGFEAIVDTDHTRRDAIALVREALSEEREVKFVHETYQDGETIITEDITRDMIEEARAQMLQAAE